jgi:hypothetical protein
LPPALQRLFFYIFAIFPLLYFVIGDFPATARLQNAFATPILFHTLFCLLIACMIWQIVVLIGQALAFSYMQNNASAQVLMLYGLSLSTAVGAIAFSIITVVVLPNHRPLQQISQHWILSALIYPLTLIFQGFLVASTWVGSFGKFLKSVSPASSLNAVLVTITAVGSSASVPATSGEAVVGMGVGKIIPDPPAAETTSLLLRYSKVLQNWFSFLPVGANTDQYRANFENTTKDNTNTDQWGPRAAQ